MQTAPEIELNLGNHCNNRCVFCECGQLTERGLAPPNPADRMRLELDRAVAQGTRRVTFLGGEPTLQPGFDELMAYAVTLGFEELIIFTNGARTGKRDFIERITNLGTFTWRFSVQGGDERTHDRNTLRPGSFRRIINGLEVLRELGQRTTVNTCVNANNVDSMPLYPQLLADHGVVQFHADMVRPHSTGDRDDDEVAALVPDYAVVRARMQEMMEGFERIAPGIEVNIGNLPHCVLPEFARSIEHGGVFTWTLTGDREGQPRDALDKYAYQREGHGYLPTCNGCLKQSQCKGVPDIAAERNDLSLIRAMTIDTLRAVSPERRDLTAIVRAYLPPISAETSADSASSASRESTGDASNRIDGDMGQASTPAAPSAPSSDCVVSAILPVDDGSVDVSVEAASGIATFRFGLPRAARALASGRDFAFALQVTDASPACTARAYVKLLTRLDRAGLGAVQARVSGAELAESLMTEPERVRAMARLRDVLRRLREVSNGDGIRFGKAQTLTDAFGVGMRVTEPDGSTGVARLVLGAGPLDPLRVEFEGVSDAAQQQIVTVANAPAPR